MAFFLSVPESNAYKDIRQAHIIPFTEAVTIRTIGLLQQFFSMRRIHMSLYSQAVQYLVCRPKPLLSYVQVIYKSLLLG